MKPSNSLSRALLLACTVGAVLVIGSGIIYGRLAQRWGPSADLSAAAKHLQDFPKSIGNWQAVAEDTLGEAEVNMLSCAGYVNRQYQNSKTGESVRVAILVGPPGPIAVHTPEICYSSRDYQVEHSREVTTITGAAGEPHTFWHVAFQPKHPMGSPLVVYYAWSAGNAWVASTNPRYAFGGGKLLHKVQLATAVDSVPGRIEDNPVHDFLQSLINSGFTLQSS